MKIYKLLTALILAGIMSGCSGSESTVVIVSTNDIHSSINNFPALATVVDGLRGEHPGGVVLVDAGDRWTGNPYVDRAPVKYSPVIALMNELGYDVATFGNHEWDSGERVLSERMGEAEFTNLMANIDPQSIDIPEVIPYKIIERDGLRIAFLGLVGIEKSGYPLGFAGHFGRAVFTDPYLTADRYKSLRDSCDFYVAVTHMGVGPDTLLACRNPELDLIIGGHSHTRLDSGMEKCGVLVTQTERNLKYAGITTIRHRGGKVISVENRLVKLDTVARDPRLAALVDKYYNEPELRKVVGRADKTMDKTALLNLFSDIMRMEAGGDFAFYNVGGMRLDGLPAGDLHRADVYMAEPFDNKPVVVLMTEEQIREFIMNKFNAEGDKESHQLDLSPSGLTYDIILDESGDASDVVLHHRFYPERGRTYKVVMSNYVNEEYDFALRGQGTATGGTVADHVFSYLDRHPQIAVDAVPRVSIKR